MIVPLTTNHIIILRLRCKCKHSRCDARRLYYFRARLRQVGQFGARDGVGRVLARRQLRSAARPSPVLLGGARVAQVDGGGRRHLVKLLHALHQIPPVPVLLLLLVREGCCFLGGQRWRGLPADLVLHFGVGLLLVEHSYLLILLLL